LKLTHICAVITGAARGIGFATASRLLQEGARVVLADIDEATLHTALERLNSPLATPAIADIAKPQDCANLVAIAQSRGTPLNLWINNAGLARHRPICEYAEHEIDLMLSVNLKGTILGSQAALRAMSAHRAGHIINVISTAGLRGIPTETVYCAAKWGARGFTQGLREEAASPHCCPEAWIRRSGKTLFHGKCPLRTFSPQTRLPNLLSHSRQWIPPSSRRNSSSARSTTVILHKADPETAAAY
jgi:NADP-dependent 3-hydroxy acid dehydrogenase YdfG